jgi:hypothetical protein
MFYLDSVLLGVIAAATLVCAAGMVLLAVGGMRRR